MALQAGAPPPRRLPSHKHVPGPICPSDAPRGKPRSLEVTCHRPWPVRHDLTSKTRLKSSSAEMQTSRVWPPSVDLRPLVAARGGWLASRARTCSETAHFNTAFAGSAGSSVGNPSCCTQ